MQGGFNQLIKGKRRGISEVMALLGLLLGTCILLLGVQWLLDLNALKDANQSGPFLTVNKPVGLLNALAGPSTFNDTDIEEIKNMPEVQLVAPFQSNEFKLRASVPRLGFHSELFFESLPETMLSDIPAEFKWYPGDSAVPILIPKDYIALYNFGFAPSQGLPQVSPGLIEQFSFSLQIQGNERQGEHRGKIAGFSDQINTILVPHDFLSWANKHYSGVSNNEPTRIAVLCEAGMEKKLRHKLTDAGYEFGSNALLNDKTASLLGLALFALVAIGLLIFLLAVYVAHLFRQLFFANQQENLIRLFHFGQDPGVLYDFFNKRFSKLIFVGLGGGILLFLLLNYLLKSWLIQQGFNLNAFPNVFTLLIGLLLLTLILINQRKQLRRFLENCYN